MAFSTIFFDLDDTLYPAENGLWQRIRQRIIKYMIEVLSIPEESVPGLSMRYFKTYGTTLRGVQIHYEVDADDFLTYVHDLPVEDFVNPDPELSDMIAGLPQGKYIFTNADNNHTQRVLSALGLSGCFDGIIDVVSMNYECKPNRAAYDLALASAGERDPKRCVYLDDSVRNLTPAYELGMQTVLVGDNNGYPVADFSIARPHDLKLVLPELWSKNNPTS